MRTKNRVLIELILLSLLIQGRGVGKRGCAWQERALLEESVQFYEVRKLDWFAGILELEGENLFWLVLVFIITLLVNLVLWNPLMRHEAHILVEWGLLEGAQRLLVLLRGLWGNQRWRLVNYHYYRLLGRAICLGLRGLDLLQVRWSEVANLESQGSSFLGVPAKISQNQRMALI